MIGVLLICHLHCHRPMRVMIETSFFWALHTGPWTGSDADRGPGFEDHFDSTRPRSGSEPRAVCVRSSPAVPMRIVCVSCGVHAKPHWIQIRDPDPVNPVSMPVWRAHRYKSPELVVSIVTRRDKNAHVIQQVVLMFDKPISIQRLVWLYSAWRHLEGRGMWEFGPS